MSTKDQLLQESLTVNLPPHQRLTVIGAALVALFLGALDALIISAAMPTVVADLGRLELYSWVYSAYFLARAVSLPIFGKLADLYQCRRLFLGAITLFLIASFGAGIAWNMTVLIAARAIQGIGAGAIFALVYIILADVSPRQERGRTLSLASSVWGIASVLGPTLGGILVTYGSWRLVFFLNMPLGLLSLWGIGKYFVDIRPKREHVTLDFIGVATLSTAILALLFAMMLGGRSMAWTSPGLIGLLTLSGVALLGFIRAERRAAEPILDIVFFRNRGFTAGNTAVFFSSFAIFSLFAYAPLFLQGSQGRTPLEVGMTMVSLSLGWSMGSLALGRVIDRLGLKSCGAAGGGCLILGSALTLTLTSASTMGASFLAFLVIGVGMGFVSLSTLLVVQTSLGQKNLGVATSSNQFARTLGGTVGVGICGSFIAGHFARLDQAIQASGVMERMPTRLMGHGAGRIEQLLQPEILALLPPQTHHLLQKTISQGTREVFWVVTLSALFCLVSCLLIPRRQS